MPEDTPESRQLTAPESRRADFLAPVNTGSGLARYEPSDLPSAMRLAEMVCRGGLVPSDLRDKPGDVLIMIATGRDYGLSWTQALQNLYIVKGRIGAYAEFLRAAIQGDPECVEFEVLEATAEEAKIGVQKAGWKEPRIVSFTIDEAIKARLAQRLESGEIVGTGNNPRESNWAKYTEEMLVARATTRAKRRYFPGVLTNLAAVEELRDLPEEKNVTPAEDRAGAAVERIRAAAGKGAGDEPRPLVVPAGAVRDLGEMPPATEIKETSEERVEKFVEELDKGPVEESPEEPVADETPAPPPDDEPDFDARKMSPKLRAELLKLPRIGEDAVSALERDGILTVHQILARGAHLNKVKGIGDGKARTLLDFAQEVVDAGKPAAEPEETPAPTEEPPAAKTEVPGGATFYRGQDYVDGLKALAEKHGAPWGEVLARAAKVIGIKPESADDFALRALPDQEWTRIQQWVESATAVPLPLEPPAAEETAPAVELIGEDRVEVLKNTLRTMFDAAKLDEQAKEEWQNAMRAWLKSELGVEVFREVPKARYGDVLAWISDHDARFKK